MEYDFTSSGARDAAAAGRLEGWVQAFLRGPGGNAGFAEGLGLAPRAFVGPVTWPLSAVPRSCGPEPGMRWAVPRESFEPRVTRLAEAYSGPWDAPPLIVEVTPEGLALNDGNHRHEALVRLGRTNAPMIFWATGGPELRRLREEFAPWAEVEGPWREGQTSGRRGVVGALMVRDDGRIFAQRRSPDRKTFPNCWDLAGGHLEPGECPREALERELREETGWGLGRLLGLRRTVDWESPGPDGRPVPKREFVFAATLEGDPDRPRLEAGKATEARWFGAGDLALLNENRGGSDTYVYDLFREELAR